MKKIVIFLQNRNFFGAQIVHIPLIKELKKKYPESSIHIFSKHKISSMLKKLNLVDEVFLEQNKITTFIKYVKINPCISINLRKKSSFINGFISFFNFKTKIGFETFLTKIFFTSSKKYNPNIYRAKNYLNLIDTSFNPEKVKTLQKISIIPGAGGDFKIWNLKNYIELAQQLNKEYPNHKICFILGETEKDFKEEISKNNFTIHYNLEINQLFKAIEESQITIANDCGPSHIAQISNSHYLILYSDEQEDAKYIIKEWFNEKKGTSALIATPKEHINSLSVQSVFQEAKNILDDYHD